MKHARLFRIFWILMVAVCFFHDTAQGKGTVHQVTAVSDVYLGNTITIDLIIRDASDHSPPVMMPVDGLDIERSQRMESTSTRVMNGVTTETKEVIYKFEVVAKQPGTYQIPSIPIVVDGQELQSKPITLTFRPSENRGFLTAEVYGSQDRLIQDESTLLTLKIKVKQFTDSIYAASPGSQEMWSLIAANSKWGPFAEAVVARCANGQIPEWQIQAQQGEDGNEENYYIYKVQAEVRPETTGPLDVSDVKISINYPLSLVRSILSTDLKIDQTRTINAEATYKGVALLPGDRRPPLFNADEHGGLKPVFGPEMKLFNGSDLDGWRGFFRDGSTDLSQSYSVSDGVLVCKGQPIGYIQTERMYENFELIVEWRFDPEKGAGNSGVLVRVIGEDKVWPNCIEGQLQSTHAGDIWNIGEFPMKAEASRTNGRNTRKAHPSSEKPLGEWNKYRILMDRGHLVLEVNGVVQNVAEDCRQVPGRIALQSEGAHIEFRKVALRPIIAWEQP